MKFSTIILFIVFTVSPLFSESPSDNSAGLNIQEDPYLAFAEEMPAPIGGLEGIYKKITYPDIARKAGLEGKVYLLVHVNENGIAEDVKVVKGIGGGCEEAAIKAVKDTKYTPGKNKGIALKVKLSLSISFKLK